MPLLLLLPPPFINETMEVGDVVRLGALEDVEEDDEFELLLADDDDDKLLKMVDEVTEVGGVPAVDSRLLPPLDWGEPAASWAPS